MTENAYEGREQTQLKHLVLEQYLQGWGHKFASTPFQGRARLWFVDCFSGPWKTDEENAEDTSIAIALRTLNAVRSAHVAGHPVDVGAVFVEKKKKSFEELKVMLDSKRGDVVTHPFEGEFGDHVNEINQLIGSAPALLFVDPTGWKGAGMKYIAPLAIPERRDVIVNVMFNFVNRFKREERPKLRKQMQEFFGLADGELPSEVSDEAQVMGFYRSQLKAAAGLQFVANVAVPHPTTDRTWFYLVVGGHHPKVLDVVRGIEKRVLGSEAATIRQGAKDRKTERDTGQMALGIAAPESDGTYAGFHADALTAAPRFVRTLLLQGPQPFRVIWPRVLEDLHLSLGDLKKIVVTMHKEGALTIAGAAPKPRTVDDHQVLTLKSAA